MAIIDAADFRVGSVADYCVGIELGADEAGDDVLDAAIARFAQRFEEACDDRFESFDDVLTISSDGGETLILPHRTTGIDYVVTTDTDGTDTFQVDSRYRLVSSLDADGARALRELDHLDVIPLQTLDNVYGSGCWPTAPGSVTVSGTFGYTVTPPDAKRAVALLVWDHFVQKDPERRRAVEWATKDASYRSGTTTPFGIPEVDQAVASLKRDRSALVGVA